jgi:bifunctional ADP-heptose synthase (sugar kinase/adenylyltransferase)
MINTDKDNQIKLITDIFKLKEKITKRRNEKLKIIHCHGIFDLVHPGLIRHFRSAKNQGDILLVSLTGDKYVNKGPGRPAFNEVLRSEVLCSLDLVDYVYINQDYDAVSLVKDVAPDVYVKGGDHRRGEDDVAGKIEEEVAAVSSVGGYVYYTDEIVYTGTELLNNRLESLNVGVESWLRSFRERYCAEEVISWIDGLAQMSALVIGEPIIDEYEFCTCIGKSSKDPMLAIHHKYTESYAGGGLAVANHVSSLCREVVYIGMVGDNQTQLKFLKDNLNPNIKFEPLLRRNSTTVIKKRFVDIESNNRLFELYTMSEGPLSETEKSNLIELICNYSAETDVTLVADYGHGMIDKNIANMISSTSKYSVINAQSNAGNRGYNLINKYSSADLVVLALHEAQLLQGDKISSPKVLAESIIGNYSFNEVIITLGKGGIGLINKMFEYMTGPSLALQVKDKVGAGDAVLAVCGCLRSIGCPTDITIFLGNLAGAQLVADIGNRTKLDRVLMIKSVNELLKNR